MKSITQRLEELAEESKKRAPVERKDTSTAKAPEPLPATDTNVSRRTAMSENAIELVTSGNQLDVFQPEVIRPELNIAKWANFIFSSPRNPHVYKARTRTFPVSIKNKKGELVEFEGSVKVEPLADHRTPTTTSYDIFLAIIHLWEEQGRPADGWVVFSSRKIAELTNKAWNGKLAKSIETELKVLKFSALTWDWSFVNSENEKEMLVDEMNLLTKKQYYKGNKRLPDDKFNAIHKVQIDSHIVGNMIAGKTKPIDFKTYISIQDSGAKVFYTFLDVILSRKTVWERKLTGLLEDLEIYSDRYKHKRIRKQLVQKWIDELEGKDLFHGKLTIQLIETSDKTDWKIIAKKTPRIVKKRVPKKLANSKREIAVLVEDITAAVGQGETHQNLYATFAKFYSADLIYQAISEMKADTNPTSKGRMLTAILHRLAHANGLDWIRDCGSECKYRPENNLFS